jgi:hypothetical protein
MKNDQLMLIIFERLKVLKMILKKIDSTYKFTFKGYYLSEIHRI